MTTSVAQFAARMAKAPAVMKQAERQMVTAAALAVTTAVRAEVGRATKGSNRLSGVGKRGAKLSVGYDVKGTASPSALVRMKGPAHLIESDTKPHPITTKQRRGARALSTPAGPRASVQHPGTKGKHPWAKGVAAGLPLAGAAATATVEKSLLKVVGG